MHMKRKQMIIGVLTGVILVFIFSALVVEKRLSDARSAVSTAFLEQEAEVKDIAQLIADGRSVEFARSQEVITACQNEASQQYDQLLSSLDRGLSAQELLTLKNLFNQCGSIPAISRAFVVFVLEQEVDTLDMLYAEQAFLGMDEKEEAPIAIWRELITKEKEINTQFHALVALQGKIIEALQSGAVGDIETIQTQVQAVQQKYAAAITEASQVRGTLVTP